MKTGKKWSVQHALKVAVEDLKLQEVIGTACRGRRGLGNYGEVQWSKTQGKPKRDMIVQHVRKVAEQNRMKKAVGMSHHRNWTRWDTLDQRSFS